MSSREETETVIAWTAADEFATVYSLMPKVWRWCERIGAKEIRLEEGIRKGVKEARTFLVPVEAIRRFRLPTSREPSQAQREALQKAQEQQKQARKGIL